MQAVDAHRQARTRTHKRIHTHAHVGTRARRVHFSNLITFSVAASPALGILASAEGTLVTPAAAICMRMGAGGAAGRMRVFCASERDEAAQQGEEGGRRDKGE